MGGSCKRCGECCVDVAVDWSRAEVSRRLRLLNRRKNLDREERELKVELEKMMECIVWNGGKYSRGWHIVFCRNLVPADNGAPARCRKYRTRMDFCREFRCY